MLSEQQIESDLTRGMRRIAAPYKNALAILRQQVDAETTDLNDITAKLKPSMQLIAECEQTLAPLRDEWKLLKKPAHGELGQLFEEQTALLRELIERLNTFEERMVNSRNHLGSRLDASQRQNAMRQAYQT